MQTLETFHLFQTLHTLNLSHVKYNFYFLLPKYGGENIVLGSNFQNGNFNKFSRFEAPESEYHIFSVWFVSAISTIQKKL